MRRGIPLLRIELFVLFHLIVDGFGIVVGDVLVDDLDAVSWEELFDISQSVRTLVWVHTIKLNILKPIPNYTQDTCSQSQAKQSDSEISYSTSSSKSCQLGCFPGGCSAVTPPLSYR